MSETYFIVISGKETTNETGKHIVEKCLPANGVKASFGSVDEYGSYCFNIDGRSHHSADFESGVTNHIAQFMSEHGIVNYSKRLDLFFLDNPYGESDTEQTLFRRLMKLKDDPKCGFNLLVVWHVVLCYDMNKPYDVNLVTDNDTLDKCLRTADGRICCNTLYISTRNINGGAAFESKEHHDFALPRTLADFMLLAASPATREMLESATLPTNVGTSVFSIGHSECMYYAPDVSRLQNLYLQLTLLNERLNGKRPECGNLSDETDILQWIRSNKVKDLLDPNKHPTGLKTIARQIKAQIGETDDPNSDVILSTVDDLISSHLSDFFGLGQYLGPEFISQEMVNDAAEDYKDAQKNGSQNKQHDAKREFENLKNEHESQIKSIASRDFLRHAKNKLNEARKNEEQANRDYADAQNEEDNISFWQRFTDCLFGRTAKRKERLKQLKKTADLFQQEAQATEKSLAAINDIGYLVEVREDFRNAWERINALEQQKRQYEYELAKFQLTTFRDTFSLVDLNKAKSHFAKQMNDTQKGYMLRLSELYANYVAAGELGNSALTTAFNTLLGEVTPQYESVDWDHPFDFLIEANPIGKLYTDMTNQSLPYVNVSKDETALFKKQQVFIFANTADFTCPNLPEMQTQYQTLQTDRLNDKICTLQVSAMQESSINMLTNDGESKDKAEPEPTIKALPIFSTNDVEISDAKEIEACDEAKVIDNDEADETKPDVDDPIC